MNKNTIALILQALEHIHQQGAFLQRIRWVCYE